jgi:hypothetical protein
MALDVETWRMRPRIEIGGGRTSHHSWCTNFGIKKMIDSNEISLRYSSVSMLEKVQIKAGKESRNFLYRYLDGHATQ